MVIAVIHTSIVVDMCTDKLICKKGHILVRGKAVKPSFTVKEGDVVDVKKSPITYSFKVLKCAENRVGAKLVPELMENVTSAEQYELLEMSRISGFVGRARGTGRPTKKERRDMDTFIEESGDFDFEEFDFDE
jgi:ribosome-associated heat shock protein Hsp15